MSQKSKSLAPCMHPGAPDIHGFRSKGNSKKQGGKGGMDRRMMDKMMMSGNMDPRMMEMMMRGEGGPCEPWEKPERDHPDTEKDVFMDFYLKGAHENGIFEVNGVPIAEHLEKVWEETFKQVESGELTQHIVRNEEGVPIVLVYYKKVPDQDDFNIWIKHLILRVGDDRQTMIKTLMELMNLPNIYRVFCRNNKLCSGFHKLLIDWQFAKIEDPSMLPGVMFGEDPEKYDYYRLQ